MARHRYQARLARRPDSLQKRDRVVAMFIFQIAGLLSSVVVLLVIVAIGFVFQPLPQVGSADDAIWKLIVVTQVMNGL